MGGSGSAGLDNDEDGDEDGNWRRGPRKKKSEARCGVERELGEKRTGTSRRARGRVV